MEDKTAKTEVPAATPSTPPEKPPAPRPPPPPKKPNRRLGLIAVIGAVILVIGVVIYYRRFIAPYESTDDAFIEGRVTVVSPRVSGPVIHLLVDDNQHVKEGEPLLEIDPGDYLTKVAQADADLATAKAQEQQAQAQTTVDEAKAEQQKSAVTAADAEASRADADLKRYESVESRAISRSQLDLARAAGRTTAAELDVARNQAKAADAQVALSRVNVLAATARVKQAEAQLEQARLDLSYTKVPAPKSGRITRRTVEQGIYVQPGQALLALVPDEVWVVANFKETQLTHMQSGQEVRIRIDTYPGRDFRGKVDSIQSGTGSRFSLLPPENAVGNYVKVVQRIPVKIVFDEPRDNELVFAPGMSVVPRVKVK